MKPNLFILGAPKAGTTSLVHYLSQHQEIFFPKYKEPHFFGSDLSTNEFQGNDKKYLSLYKNITSRWLGDASTWYLYSKFALNEISDYCQVTKLIIMLRNPIEAVPSLFLQSKFTLNEDVEKLTDALDLEQNRKLGKNIPIHNKRIESLFYSEAFSYKEQLSRVFSEFTKENIHIIIFDDFKKNTNSEIRKVFEFLGLNFVDNIDISPQNERKTFRSRQLQFLIQNGFIQTRKFIPLNLRQQIKSLLLNLNLKKTNSYELTIEEYNRLQNIYRDDIEYVEKIIDRNLLWLGSEKT